MMQIFFSALLLLLIPILSATATTVNGRFIVSNTENSTCTVLLQINTNTGYDDLGGSTIIFGFDTTALSLKSTPVRNVDYIFHNFSGGNYSEATITRPKNNRIWVNIDLPFTNNNNGTLVTGNPGWTNVVSIKFTIVNPNRSLGLKFITTSLFWGIFDANNFSIWSAGSFEGNFGLDVQVYDDWNLVSVPGINPDGQGVDNWWPYRDHMVQVFKMSGGIVPIATTTPGEGYWMKHTGSRLYNTGDEWPIEGIEVVPHNPINANSGWNLIGVFENVVAANSITTNPPDCISGPIYSYAGAYHVVTSLKPGKGYFIKTSGTCQINIPNELSKGNEASSTYFSEDWGKITFIDNSDRSFSLYLTDLENDLSFFELPPLPIDEIFDIRFESGRLVENISNRSNAILMNGIEYPVRVRVENISISLQDISGTKFDAKLEHDEEITISDRTINKLLIQSGKSVLPIDYSLEQNYPNPFNPVTTISFTLPFESNVNLSLYNVLGELILTLVDQEIKPGKHEYRLNASGLSSGIYIYKITAGDFIQSKKMVLLR
jgi:hypothetical protein